MRPFALVGLLLALLGTAAAVPDSTLADPAPYQLNVPVLMYHRIQCADPGERYPNLFICPDAFDSQMAAIAADGWTTITSDQLADDMVNGVCPGPKTLVITIDDGALDGYTNAAPILEKYGLRGTFSMVVSKVGDYLTNPAVKKPHFDWDQARDLIARGHGIADHTMTHVSVDTLTTQTKLDNQIQTAQDILQSQLGFAPKVFVYPSGATGNAAAQSYLSARFELALTTAYGALESTTKPMLAPRMRIDPSLTSDQVMAMLSPFADPCADTIPRPNIKVTPPSANLGYAVTGTTSASTPITVKNTGTADLHVSSVGFNGDNATEFGIGSDGCSGVAVAPNGTCVIGVDISPTTDGPKAASLDIYSDAPARPVAAVALTSTAGAPSNASIDIQVVARPHSSQEFSFAVSDGQPGFTLTDDGTGANTTHLVLAPGTYEVSVAPLSGWTVTGITCAQPQLINKPAGRATITVSDGDNASCTFTETQRIPDASIATAANGPFEEPGFLSTVSTPQQTVAVSMSPGTATSLYVHLTNAGPAKDTFVVRAFVTGSAYDTVTFSVNGTDVTKSVLAGTWLSTIKPGKERLLVITLSAAPDAPPGWNDSISVKFRSKTTTNTWDMVGATVTGS